MTKLTLAEADKILGSIHLTPDRLCAVLLRSEVTTFADRLHWARVFSDRQGKDFPSTILRHLLKPESEKSLTLANLEIDKVLEVYHEEAA